MDEVSSNVVKARKIVLCYHRDQMVNRTDGTFGSVPSSFHETVPLKKNRQAIFTVSRHCIVVVWKKNFATQEFFLDLLSWIFETFKKLSVKNTKLTGL
jgi:hypothetical protein